MPKIKNSFRAGHLVRGQTFANITIIGKYVAARASFGVLVFGRPEYSTDPPSEHVLRRLTLESWEQDPPILRQRGRPPQGFPVKLEAKDPCSGLTKKGQTIIGTYQNPAQYPYAYIRGRPIAQGQVDYSQDIQAYKVLRNSLKRL